MSSDHENGTFSISYVLELCALVQNVTNLAAGCHLNDKKWASVAQWQQTYLSKLMFTLESISEGHTCVCHFVQLVIRIQSLPFLVWLMT